MNQKLPRIDLKVSTATWTAIRDNALKDGSINSSMRNAVRSGLRNEDGTWTVPLDKDVYDEVVSRMWLGETHNGALQRLFTNPENGWTEVQVTADVFDLMKRASIGTGRVVVENARENPDGTAVVPISGDIYQQLLAYRRSKESFNDLMRRLCADILSGVRTAKPNSKVTEMSVMDAARYACEDTKHLAFADMGDIKGVVRVLKPLLYKAAYFEVGNDVLEAALTLGTDFPDVLVGMMPRCRPPFPVTVLEWNVKHALHYVGQEPQFGCPETACAIIEQEPGSDGFYITVLGSDHSVPDFERGAPSGEQRWVVGPSVMSFHVSPDVPFTGHHSELYDIISEYERTPFDNRPRQDLREASLSAGCPVEILDEPGFDHAVTMPMILGRWKPKPELWQHYQTLSKHFNLELCHAFSDRLRRALSDQTMVRWHSRSYSSQGARSFHTPRSTALKFNVTDGAMREDMGIGRKVLAILALLNAKDREISWGEGTTPPGRMRAGDKLMPYFSRRKLTLTLPRALLLRRIAKVAIAQRKPKRRHPVIGHWCSSNKRGNPECQHEHEATSPTLKTCKHCGHIVWWRPAHERGDAGRGWVSKVYRLQKRPKLGYQPPEGVL